ncbi:MAG: pyridoxamine 5'-phosphate oxidase family protein [Anaerolineae bacterium]|nr:pyridoxamine 5'-phosphate oxidase family protein [Anaerolineae bacterium]
MAIELIRTSNFADIEQEFLARVQKVVWCNVATVDSKGRPRSRILHPIWEGSTGWITTRRHSPKSKQLAQNPYVSLAYVADVGKPFYADCRSEWVDDLAEKQRVWDLLCMTPPPLGFDPAPLYHSVDHPDFGLLKLTPWRIEVATLPVERRVWQP